MLHSITFPFETAVGDWHSLIIKFDSDPELSRELVNTVEEAFLTTKELLANYKEDGHFVLPDKTLLNMSIFYLSNGKYKDVVEDLIVNISINETHEVVIKLKNQVYHNMTPLEVAIATENILRKPLWWENIEKKFFHIENRMSKIDLVRNYLEQGEILKCYYDYNVYFFNIGIEEPEVTEYMIEEADWFLYTWI